MLLVWHKTLTLNMEKSDARTHLFFSIIWHPVLHDLNKVCAEIDSKYGMIGAVGIPMQCDISDPDQTKGMFKKIVSEVQLIT